MVAVIEVPHPGIDLEKETLITLSQAARLIPGRRQDRGQNGRIRPTSATAIWRWVTTGKNGVRLDALRTPDGTWFTTAPAVARFLRQLAAQSFAPRGHARNGKQTLDVEARQQRAAAILDAAGI